MTLNLEMDPKKMCVYTQKTQQNKRKLTIKLYFWIRWETFPLRYHRFFQPSGLYSFLFFISVERNMFLFKLKASLVKDIYNKIHSTFFALSHSQHLAAVTSLLTFLLFIFGPKGFFFLIYSTQNIQI